MFLLLNLFLSISSIATTLASYNTPTLVQVNHLAGVVTEVTPPKWDMTLNEMAIAYNVGAPESTTYMIAGMSL